MIRNDKATSKVKICVRCVAASKGPPFWKKKEEFVEKINSNEFRFRDAGVLEIKNRSAVNLEKQILWRSIYKRLLT